MLAPRRCEALVTVKPPSPLEQYRAYRAGLSLRGRRILGLGIAIVVFCASWAMLTHWFYAHPPIIDTPLYKGFSASIRHGS